MAFKNISSHRTQLFFVWISKKKLNIYREKEKGKGRDLGVNLLRVEMQPQITRERIKRDTRESTMRFSPRRRLAIIIVVHIL